MRPHRRLCWLVLFSIPLFACTDDDPTGPEEAEDVGDYFQELPSWSDFSPLAEPMDPTQTGEAEQLPDETLDVYHVSSFDADSARVDTTENVTYSCVSVPYTMSDNPEQIVMYSPDREILWPGALIQGKSRKELGSLLGLPIAERAPINVSIPRLPSGDQYRTVEGPNQAKVSAAIGEMIGNATIADLPTPTSVNFKLETYHSEEQFALSVGVSGSYMGFHASANTSVERNASETTVAAQFTEKMYEVVVEPPQTPDAFFSEEFTQEVLQEQIDLGRIGPGNIPVYVSNVVYGRMMMFSMTSTANERDLRATMTAGYENKLASVETEVAAKYRTILQHSKIAFTSLGGGEASLDVIRSGDWTQYFTEAAPLSTAEPLSYTFRSLDGQIAVVTEATDYNIRICTPKAAGEGGIWFGEEQLVDLRVDVPAHPVTGDFDGDGRLDLAFNHRAVTANEVEVLLASGDAVYQSAGTTSTHPESAPHGWGTYDVRAGDVNGDGRDDLVWNHRDSTANITYVGLSDGAGGFTFPDSTVHWAQEWTYDLDGVETKYGFDLADINGDGRDDILWPGSGDHWIRIYTGLGQADGSFHLPSYHETTGYQFRDYTIADVGGDGRADFVAIEAHPDAMWYGVLTSEGNGHFSYDCCASVAGDFSGGAVLPGDLDGNSKADNVWLRTASDTVRAHVLLANGAGTNLAHASMATTGAVDTGTLGAAVVDLNGDGRDDLVVNRFTDVDGRHYNESFVGLAGPDGALTFDGGSQEHPLSHVPWDNFHLFSGDVDGDGRGDLVWVHAATPARIFVGRGN